MHKSALLYNEPQTGKYKYIMNAYEKSLPLEGKVGFAKQNSDEVVVQY